MQCCSSVGAIRFVALNMVSTIVDTVLYNGGEVMVEFQAVVSSKISKPFPEVPAPVRPSVRPRVGSQKVDSFRVGWHAGLAPFLSGR